MMDVRRIEGFLEHLHPLLPHLQTSPLHSGRHLRMSHQHVVHFVCTFRFPIFVSGVVSSRDFAFSSSHIFLLVPPVKPSSPASMAATLPTLLSTILGMNEVLIKGYNT